MNNRFYGLLISVGLALSTASQASETDPFDNLVGRWIMPIFIGERQFDDIVIFEKLENGTLGGTLEVPGQFKSKLENINLMDADLSFEIVADEGRGPFRVIYKARLNHERTAFVGFARLGSGQFLGGFATKPKSM